MPVRNSKDLPDTSFLPSPDTIKEMAVPERDDLIFYLYFIKGVKQTVIAEHYNLAQPTISEIITKYKQNPTFKDRAIQVWEKDISIECRRKAAATVNSIDPEKIPEGSKAQTAGILIDKARLIDNESTQNVAYADMSRELKDIEDEEAALERQLGTKI